MKTPVAPGSLTAVFFYQGEDGDANDEIDIEIPNDGSRRVMFNVWRGGQHWLAHWDSLSFEPSHGFHEYGVNWTSEAISFLVDGESKLDFTAEVLPANPMFAYVNIWWPEWTELPDEPQMGALEIESIVH